jgi:hypothetical protein
MAVTLWQPYIPTARAFQALARLELPSLAQPLPGSVPCGLNLWLFPRPPSAVEEAYGRPDAPVPQGAVVRKEGEGILVVEGPFRASGIFLSPHPEGCLYKITPGPSLLIKGAGKIPSGGAFCRVSPMPFDSSPDGLGGSSFACEAVIGGAGLSVVVFTSGDGGGEKATEVIIAKGTLAGLNAGKVKPLVKGAAAVERGDSGYVRATVKAGSASIVIEAIHTDSVTAVMKSARYATCELSASKGSPPSRPKLSGEGFEAGEAVEIRFDDAVLTQAKADSSGRFTKAVTIPATAAPGLHSVKASGRKSGLAAEAPFRVLPPRNRKPPT